MADPSLAERAELGTSNRIPGGLIGAFIKACRPSQWTKNLVVFAAVFFTRKITDPTGLATASFAFILFSFLSSAVYIVNDILDRDEDRQHPQKRHRPIASGALPVPVAVAGGALLAITALVLGFRLSFPFGMTLLTYFVLNLLYSIKLKEVVGLDVLLISTGFVLRAIGGVEALVGRVDDVLLSPWLLVCTLFLSLFLALSKRRVELATLGDGAIGHRAVLAEYSKTLVDHLIVVVASSTIVAYTIYTIWPDTVSKFGTDNLVYTVPFVVYGIFRYLYLVFRKNTGGNPSEVLYKDRPILLTMLLWIGVTFIIIFR
jgi:4-hydroxybenzoate polyprenyltransferase